MTKSGSVGRPGYLTHETFGWSEKSKSKTETPEAEAPSEDADIAVEAAEVPTDDAPEAEPEAVEPASEPAPQPVARGAGASWGHDRKVRVDRCQQADQAEQIGWVSVDGHGAVVDRSLELDGSGCESDECVP